MEENRKDIKKITFWFFSDSVLPSNKVRLNRITCKRQVSKPNEKHAEKGHSLLFSFQTSFTIWFIFAPDVKNI